METDVVIVGGGVAGGAVAARLAASGASVLILEREAQFTDRVRGEGLVPWGYAEAEAMGLGEVVTGTPGANAIRRFVPYDERVTIEQAEQAALDLTAVRPGSPGIIGVGHPGLRQSLLERALESGAEVRRGVDNVSVELGERPAVNFSVDGSERRASARLVIGADGKDSGVRRSINVKLRVTEPRLILTGMLVDDDGAWDRSVTTIGIADGLQFFVIPRGDRLVRLYLAHPRTAPEGFTGPDRKARFLDSFTFSCLPHSAELRTARPVGPCAGYEMTDSWTDDPTGPGAVLIGDAAGWSDPIIGQGLAVAFRDARVLTDILLSQDQWSGSLLRAYVEERQERMRRLRYVSALTSLLNALGAPDRQIRCERMQAYLSENPKAGRAQIAGFVGPSTLPADAFEPALLAALALA